MEVQTQKHEKTPPIRLQIFDALATFLCMLILAISLIGYTNDNLLHLDAWLVIVIKVGGLSSIVYLCRWILR